MRQDAESYHDPSGLANSAWLLDYWSRDRLFSAEARRAWLDPDIRELPF